MSTQAVSSETPTASSSLLSLSIAAASASRIPVVLEPTPQSSSISGSYNGPSSLPSSSGITMNIASAKLHTSVQKHRRMSSTGLTKRRLSDAREAASRPSAVTIQTAAAALSSLATLSLSGSPPPPLPLPHSSNHNSNNSFSSASELIRSQSTDPIGISSANSNNGSVKQEDEETNNTQNSPEGSGISKSNGVASASEVSVGGGISIRNTTGKKRGTIFKCESCSKVYRHPSCLIKHRWEHSPHWREASKFLLSKHQQVQLLEAAAILSHISPSANGGTSLPEDRSLWPSFLSGGLLPPPSTANSLPYNSTSSSTNGNSTSNSSMHTPAPTLSSSSLETHLTYPISSSVPAGTSGMGMVGPGPRMHDYAILGKKGGVTVTHVRPGVLGVSTGSSSSSSPPLASLNVQSSSMNGNGEQQVSTRPMPVPVPLTTNGYGYLGRDGYRDGGFSFMSGTGTEDSWGSPVSLMMHAISSSVRSSACEEACEGSRGSGKVGGGGEGGWSLPRSSIRSSGSGSGSRSRSASKSDEDEEDEEVRDEFGGEELDVDVMDVDGIGMRGGIGGVQHGQKYGFVSRGRRVGVVGSKGRFRGWGEEEGELEVHEEKVEEEWDGMEMDMEM